MVAADLGEQGEVTPSANCSQGVPSEIRRGSERLLTLTSGGAHLLHPKPRWRMSQGALVLDGFPGVSVLPFYHPSVAIYALSQLAPVPVSPGLVFRPHSLADLEDRDMPGGGRRARLPLTASRRREQGAGRRQAGELHVLRS